MQHLERPDGSVVTPIGWILIICGIVSAFFAATAESINGTLLGVALANLGIGLGVLLLSLGYLVRAIWFLPSRQIVANEQSGESGEKSVNSACGWCGRRLPTGSIACTSLTHEQLCEVGPKVPDPVCQKQLHDRGYRDCQGNMNQ